MTTDRRMEKARALAFEIAPYEADDERCAFRAAKWEIIATALAEAEREGERRGLKHAAQIATARLPLYTDIGQRNAIHECVSSILSEADGNG